jgi:hypothetical protein
MALGERIGLRVRHVMRGDERSEVGNPGAAAKALARSMLARPTPPAPLRRRTFMETSLVVQV